jgi:hypothetical protein
MRQGWVGRPVDHKAAAGILIAGLGILAASLGVRRGPARLLKKNACAVLDDDALRIGEQTSAVATATAVRDPFRTLRELPIGWLRRAAGCPPTLHELVCFATVW